MMTKNKQEADKPTASGRESRDAELDRRIGEVVHKIVVAPVACRAQSFQMDYLIKERGKRLSVVDAKSSAKRAIVKRAARGLKGRGQDDIKVAG